MYYVFFPKGCFSYYYYLSLHLYLVYALLPCLLQICDHVCVCMYQCVWQARLVRTAVLPVRTVLMVVVVERREMAVCVRRAGQGSLVTRVSHITYSDH